MKIAHTIIHYRLFWKAVLGFNGLPLGAWIVILCVIECLEIFFFFFVSLCFDVCFALLWRIPARLFFIYWQIDLFTCISSFTLHLYFIVYFAFDKYLFVFSLWLKFILSWWSSDCIGSAFNVKGAMQCPNCRKIEKGQWLYANGCRSLPEFTMDDWAHDEDLYDLSYSEMVNGFFFPS
jgi:hypothetical protein